MEALAGEGEAAHEHPRPAQVVHEAKEQAGVALVALQHPIHQQAPGAAADVGGLRVDQHLGAPPSADAVCDQLGPREYSTRA